MNLFTPEQKAKLLHNGNEENRDKDHAPVVKLFLPFSNCVWLLSEVDAEDHNIAFGLCDLGMGFPEMGNVYLPELEELKHPLVGLKVENDKDFVGRYALTVYANAAREVSAITEDEDLLLKHHQAAMKRKAPKP